MAEKVKVCNKAERMEDLCAEETNGKGGECAKRRRERV